MSGIQSLMGGQGPMPGQNLMPGQAPQQPLPGMMPQQGAPTPQAMVTQLAAMPFEQLSQFYSNPRPQSPPLWAVISAIAEKQKTARAMQMAQGQSAMAQNQQMQAQPPVAAEVLMSAANTPGMEEQDTVMAALGGEMHGYADGGAVAFQSGTSQYGLPFPATSRRIDVGGDIPIYAPSSDKEPGETEAEYQARKQREATEADEVSNRPLRRLYRYVAEKIREPSPVAQMRTPVAQAARPTPPARTADTSKLFPFGPPESPMMDVPEIAIAPSRGTGAGQRRQTAVQKPSATGISALQEQPPTPPVDNTAAASAALQEAIRLKGQTTPEVTAAQAGIDKLLGESAASVAGEAQRRRDLAQQRMQEAQSRFERPGLQDMAGIGRLLAGMAGAKTLYGGLTGAGAAAGKYQEDKEAALRAAQERFDLSGKEVFELSRLQDQVRMKQAELAEARASGNAQRAVQVAMELATEQKNLAAYQTELGMKREDLALKGRQVGAQEKTAEAAMIGAKARAEGAGSGAGGQRLALSQMKADPDYKRIQEELVAAGKLAASLPNNPKYRARLENAQREYAALAKAYGVDLKAATPEAAAGAGAATNDPLGIRKP